MRKRVFIKSNRGEDVRNEVFRYDYTASLNRQMNLDKNGFWHSRGSEIILEKKSPCHTFYKKAWAEVEPECISSERDKEVNMIRERVNDRGLEAILVQNKSSKVTPAIVICLGGPITPIPDIMAADSVYHHFIQQGFSLIIPLRRGVSGISPEWEQGLDGHYGEYDVDDTVDATDFVLSRHADTIDVENVFLYGGSYGGFVAELIAGKTNTPQRYKAIIAHCGVYDIATYPWHSQGVPSETMLTYGGTSDISLYTQQVKKISPKTYVSMWDVPILLVHHLNDTSTWIGQSVAAYNDALKLGKHIALLIVQGPHTYDIPHKEALFRELASFFKIIHD